MGREKKLSYQSGLARVFDAAYELEEALARVTFTYLIEDEWNGVYDW
jgi:hypothetical protein